ncbi:MAG: kelch repeat-containing protein [Maribacter sp.]
MKTIKLLTILFLLFCFTSCQKEDLDTNPFTTLETHAERAVNLSFRSFLSISSYPLFNTARPMFYKTATTVFKNALWKVTSYETDDMAVTVSRSTNGTSWTRMTVLPNNYAPHRLHLVVFNEELWLSGNRAPEDRFHTPLFKSKDGITWEKVVGPSSSRTPTNIFVFKNRLYTQTANGSMFFTKNGVKWVGVTHFLPKAISRNSKIVVFKKVIYAFTPGFFDFSGRQIIPNQIWKSTNAKDWVLVPQREMFVSPRGGCSVTVYNGQIWVIGGHYYSNTTNTTYDEIWFTKDLTNWEKYEGKNSIEPMFLQSATVFKEKLWLFNGTEGHLTHTDTHAIQEH